MKNFELMPNKSLGLFVLGENIKNYFYLPYVFKHEEFKSFSIDNYEFYGGNVEIWIRGEDNDKIWTICCNVVCYWKGKNLIGMLYENFLVLAGKYPDNKSIEYVPISSDRGQNQTVYDFDGLGLQIWVWRDRIKTVLISKYEEEERVT